LISKAEGERKVVPVLNWAPRYEGLSCT